MDLTHHYLSELQGLLPKLILVVVAVVAAWLVFFLTLFIYNFRRLVRQKVVYLELTPPAFTDRAASATGQLFAALHGLGLSRRLGDRLLRRRSFYSLEIVSTRKDGIRYIVRVAKDKADALEHTLSAYLPEVKVRKIDDYLTSIPGTNATRINAFRQKEHFAYPLQSHELLESHDPIGYITNAMTKLSSDELIAFQVILSPVQVQQAENIRRQILNNEDLLPRLSRSSGMHSQTIFGAINSLLFGVTGAVGSAYHGPSKVEYQSSLKEAEYRKQIAKHLKPVRTLSYFEHQLIESIHLKLAQPLFRTDIRVLISAESKQELTRRRKSLESALSLFSVPKYQSLQTQGTRYGWFRGYQRYGFAKRLPAVWRSSNLLAASEVAALYHFPNSITAKTENVIKSLSKTLPAPVSLKNGTKLDVLLGENNHQGTTTPIGLTSAERERHVYIIGGTGNGKTTMLLYGIVQDIVSGKGVAVLDPHGDLAETILLHIPKERIKDVIYLNPDDLTHPIGINLLEIMPGLSGDDLLREKDLITESTISVLRKIFSEDDSGGHRIEYVLRNAIQTALTLEGSNLFTIFRLLNDTKYRKDIVKNLEDKDLKIFWQNELGKAGDFQKVKMAAGITSKIGRFLFSASAKRVLEQEKSTIDFDDILNSGKILICNFSKGLLGEDTSTLFGTTVLAKLQVASLRRVRIKQANRTPYYLYVDEFQNFATMSFVQMLSEARKYKLFLTMAEQSTSQQDQQRLVDIILANVGTVICFRSGSPADERYVLPLFYPYIEQGEIANLPSFNFYMRLAAVEAQEPMSGTTVLLSDEGSERVAEQVIANSRLAYAKKPELIQEINRSEAHQPNQNNVPEKKPARNANGKSSELRASKTIPLGGQ